MLGKGEKLQLFEDARGLCTYFSMQFLKDKQYSSNK